MAIPQIAQNAVLEPPSETESILWIGWRRPWMIVLGFLVGSTVSAVIGLILPSVYQSSAQIAVVKKRPDAVTGVDTRQMASEEYLAPPQDLLKSSLIIKSAINKKSLAPSSIFKPDEAELTERIQRALTVTPARGPSGQGVMFKLAYRGSDAEHCRTVLAAILESYKDFIDKKHQSVSEDTIELIMREKQTLQKELAEKEAAYRVFREKAPLLGKGKDGLELRQERLTSIQTKRSALLLQRIEFEGQLAALEVALKEGRGTETILTMINEFARKNEAGDPGREKQLNLQEQLMPLLQEERNLLKNLGPKHPDVLAVRDRIEVARRLVLLPSKAWKSGASDVVLASTATATDDTIGVHLQLLRQKLSHLKISEELLMNVFQAEQDEAKRLASFEIQNETFRTEISHSQQMYESLVKRLNEVSLIRNVGGYQIELIEPPSLGRRVAPSMTIALMVGGFLGIAAGFLLALLTHRRDAQNDSARLGLSPVLSVK